MANSAKNTAPDEKSDERRSILQVSNLTKIYEGDILAVDGIDFDLEEGDFNVIIGPSGCGKSTTLHSIVGTIETTDGSIILDGKDITTTPTYSRNIGLVFQDFQLFPHLSVEENIRYGLERTEVPQKEADKRVEGMISSLRLNSIRERKPKILSAGQQQRTALARSLVLEPSLLLLDEPLGDLDYKLQKHMERQLLQIHREMDTTFVYVTHDQRQAMRLADKITVMNQGKIEQSGSVDEVYNSPNTAFVAAFLGDSNIFQGEVVDSIQEDDSVHIDTHQGKFKVSTKNTETNRQEIVGEKAFMIVRPQYIMLDGNPENSICCAVSDVIKQPGQATQIYTTTKKSESPKEIQIKTWKDLSIGGEIEIGWDSADAILTKNVSISENVDLRKDILGK